MTRKYERFHPQGHVLICDAVLFIIDEIAPGDKSSVTESDTIVGHFVLMKDGKEVHHLPTYRVKRNQAVRLDGIRLKTGIMIKYK
jgi:hypothetical protein